MIIDLEVVSVDMDIETVLLDDMNHICSVHEEKDRSKDRSLWNARSNGYGSWSWAVEPCKMSSSGKLWRYPLENCSCNTKRMSQTIEEDLVVSGIKSSTEIEHSELSYLAHVGSLVDIR